MWQISVKCCCVRVNNHVLYVLNQMFIGQHMLLNPPTNQSMLQETSVCLQKEVPLTLQGCKHLLRFYPPSLREWAVSKIISGMCLSMHTDIMTLVTLVELSTMQKISMAPAQRRHAQLETL